MRARLGASALLTMASMVSLPSEARPQAPVSAEIVVSAAPQIDEQMPSVAMDASGRGLVWWQSDVDYLVRGQAIEPDGGLIEPPVVWSEGRRRTRARPRGGLAPLGTGLVAWSSFDPGCGWSCSKARRVRSPGEPAGEVFVASETPESGGFVRGVSVNRDGRLSLTWQVPLSNDLWAIWTRSFHEDGTPATGDRFVADARRTPEMLVESDVAILPSGETVVVWSGTFLGSVGHDVRAQRFSSDGSRLGEPFRVDEYQQGDQTAPVIAADDDGRFVVAWDSVGQDGSGDGIYARVFDSQGVPQTAEIQVSSNARSLQFHPAVAVDPDGSFLVAYESSCETNDSCEDVYLRAFRPDGSPLGPQQEVNDESTLRRETPAVALSASGLAVVGWAGRQIVDPVSFRSSDDIFARRYVMPCLPGPRTLCLGDHGRFMVRAFFESHDGSRGFARTTPWTRDAGGLWYFAESNLELAVKVLDACELDGTHWVFASGLTDVRTLLTVTDTWTGQSRPLSTRAGEMLAASRFVGELGSCGVGQPAGAAAGEPSSERTSLAELGGSAPSLLLREARLRVTARWRRPDGTEGVGTAVRLADGAGLFWFFDPRNPELVVKALDGCSLNDRIWLGAAGLTDVEVELQVEDLVRGVTRTFRNPQGEPFVSILDSSTFAACR